MSRLLIASLALGALLVAPGCGAAERSTRPALVSAGEEALAGWVGGPTTTAGTPEAAQVVPEAGRGGKPGRLPDPDGTGEATPDVPGPGFYRIVESDGKIRFVSDLSGIPIDQRAAAERLDLESARAAGHGRGRSRPRPVAAAKAAPPPAATARGPADVVVYTTAWCGWCRKTLAWLDARGVDYVNKDIERNAAWAREMRALTGSGSVPVIVIDGEVIEGFDQTRLKALLSG